MKIGKWPKNDLRRAFVAGAQYWEYISTGFTMWPSDRNLCEKEAKKRYPKRNLIKALVKYFKIE